MHVIESQHRENTARVQKPDGPPESDENVLVWDKKRKK